MPLIEALALPGRVWVLGSLKPSIRGWIDWPAVGRVTRLSVHPASPGSAYQKWPRAGIPAGGFARNVGLLGQVFSRQIRDGEPAGPAGRQGCGENASGEGGAHPSSVLGAAVWAAIYLGDLHPYLGCIPKQPGFADKPSLTPFGRGRTGSVTLSGSPIHGTSRPVRPREASSRTSIERQGCQSRATPQVRRLPTQGVLLSRGRDATRGQPRQEDRAIIKPPRATPPPGVGQQGAWGGGAATSAWQWSVP
ncbi:hypothetical protein H6P81_021459 [Aristolochia fimbriata]|uniref:Uncharacterized protein n=1 Tax=Aristolochia fimbriata TaxID=158543 RepID=A0AAV7DSX4_ARIFI|nr:hypothetical protein H6P81_021459 [Aristolochia fimbriata]